MQTLQGKTAIIVGAGIVGLAHARSLLLRGYQVQVFERHPAAVGASIRNFGMVWPIGQPDGPLYERAMRSRHIWQELCQQAGIWYDAVGSLHAATTALEATVMQELAGLYEYRGARWLSAAELAAKSAASHRQHCLGALWSPTEMIVEARQAIGQVAGWLQAQGVVFHFGTAVTEAGSGRVVAGGRHYEADLVLICSGADFETLYPQHFAQAPITRCQLQMMRLAAQPAGFHMGPALCGGLSLIHYKSFEAAASLGALRSHYQQQMPQYLAAGIHVMACHSPTGEITVGDTHEYGLHLTPFDRAEWNQWVLQYLDSFAIFPQRAVAQTWNGQYAKLTNGATEWVAEPEPGVWVVNGLGGAGMTLSFGLAEELAERW